MEQQIADLSKTLAEIHTQNKAIQTKMESLDEIKTSVRQLVGWKPEVDKAVNELQGEVRDLRSQVGHLARNPVLSVKPVDLPPNPSSPGIRAGSGTQGGDPSRHWNSNTAVRRPR
jgi:hypothetical protein